MSKSLRLSEQWFRRGLWLVALAFASCLIGLGSIVVGDLPRVEHQAQRDDFIDVGAVAPLRGAAGEARRAGLEAAGALEQASLKLQAAQQAYANARDSFKNWLDTRKATALPDQDAELIARTKALDALKAAEADTQQAVDLQRQRMLDADQAQTRAQAKVDALETAAQDRLDAANASAETRVFVYRLALILPLIAVAGWLFQFKRQSTWWPFVWGFILFVLYTFFVELVAYLPSYGGYVYYGVGLILTVLVGRQAIVALNNYMARQRLAEQQPDKVRRTGLSYDTALARLAKNICPGCERPVDLKAAANDFCPHCGIGLFNRCGACTARKSTFAPFCHACGVPAAGVEARA